jgi:alpha-glucosidase
LKFGFVHVGPAEWTDWLHQAIRKCAQAKLLVDVHDEYRPTGFDRTCPNLLTVEGIRGNEHRPDAGHNCTLPFARFTAGPADYTPALLSERIGNTYAHQLALPVIFFSPLQCLFWLGERPFEQPDRPEYAFWRGLPTTWDQTRLPQARIGAYVVVARRKGDVWYLGVITNQAGRELEIPLDFLAPGRWQADCFLDDPQASGPRRGIALDRRDVGQGDSLKLLLCPGGGAAVRLGMK